jgi:mannose-6-phosphate isomerase-like protein (cupin superfamily)
MPVWKKEVGRIIEFEAGDHTRLREVLHPKNDALPVSFSLAHAWLAPGSASLPHTLQQSETYYFLSGTGKMVVEPEETEVQAGTVVYVPPGIRQWVENTGASDLVFLCIVDPPWTEEGEELL